MAPIATIFEKTTKTSNIMNNSRSDNNSLRHHLEYNNNNGIAAITNNINNTSKTPCALKAPLVVCVCGPPCRGKSLYSHRIARHLTWKGENAKVFSVGTNTTIDTLIEITDWFDKGNNVAIIDGMHLTKSSRQFVSSYCNESVYHYLIIELNCDSDSLVKNINETVNFYQQQDNNIDWYRTFIEKNKLYSSRFENCSPLEGSLICVNNSEDPQLHSVTAKGVRGSLQTSILGVLASPVHRQQVFYFSRHGESEFNVLGRIGGDSDLSERGQKYADNLTHYFVHSSGTANLPTPKLIWTSEYQRTIHTAQNVPGSRAAVKDLNEINAGICEGLTYEEIQERFPQEFAWRDQDKLKYRYPHGESYLDLLQRVDAVVQALLTNTDVLVISHQAVLRCIMAYFKGTTPDQVPYINVPLHTLLVVRSMGYDFNVETVALKVECVDTYRYQPKNCSIERTTTDALVTVPAHFDSAIIPQEISSL